MQSPVIELQHIRAFYLVATHRSFTGAAAEWGVSKSKVSKLVTQYEALLGDIRLLTRTTRQVELTEIGTIHYARAGLLLGYFYATHAPFAVTEAASTI